MDTVFTFTAGGAGIQDNYRLLLNGYPLITKFSSQKNHSLLC
jgi:hypothetical protein